MKNYIFDLYGTLVDIHTDEQSAEFKKRYAEYFKKIDPQKDFFAEYVALCDKLVSGKDENYEPDLFSVFSELAGERAGEAAHTFRRLSTQYIKLYDGVKPFLRGLKARGAKLFILSNAQSCFTLAELEKLKISQLFDGILLSSDFGRKKPDKSFFAHMLAKYSLDTKDSIYAGNDICADVCGAESVGLRSAYVLSNLSPQGDTLAEAEKRSCFACKSHRQLYEYLLSIY